ncbi:MAG: universal stress protein [Parvibaculaceae bacterium]|nr:universal stress protein [Parvibaculaceae bacterium]
MSVRKILVPLAGREGDATVLGTALVVAKQFGAQLVALYVRLDPVEALPYLGDGVSGQVIDDLIKTARESANNSSARIRESLAAAAQAAGVHMVDNPCVADLPSVRFIDIVGHRDEVIAEHSRLSDLVIFNDAGTSIEAGGTALEAAMISAGRPVLITPTRAALKVGGTVAIGWDESNEAAHAVMAAIPFLETAEKVVIFAVEADVEDAKPGSALADYLSLHGVTAEIVTYEKGNRAIGEILLEQAQNINADLLVMGGYGHSRLRELLIGGTTRHIRAHTTIPVLMAH